MSPEKTKALIEAAPTLFRRRHKPITENLMAFGFECGDGWFNLLRDASIALEEYINWKYADVSEDERPLAVQVKEKYGTLRFYMGWEDYTIGAITSFAEQRSKHTCEMCGEWGSLRGKSWLYTACDEHTKEADKKLDTED